MDQIENNDGPPTFHEMENVPPDTTDYKALLEKERAQRFAMQTELEHLRAVSATWEFGMHPISTPMIEQALSTPSNFSFSNMELEAGLATMTPYSTPFASSSQKRVLQFERLEGNKNLFGVEELDDEPPFKKQKRGKKQKNELSMPQVSLEHCSDVCSRTGVEIKEINEIYAKSDRLTHDERTKLFHALITFLYTYVKPPLSANEIYTVSVHSIAQLMGKLQKEAEFLEWNLEETEGKTERTAHYLPKWLAEGLKTYAIEVRPNFLKQESAAKLTRQFEADDVRKFPAYEVTSEQFFVNRNGTQGDLIRVPQIANNFKTAVRNLLVITPDFLDS